MWDSYVEFIRATIFVAAQLCNGSLGYGILLVSFLVRLGLLPLTLRLARYAQEQRRRLEALQPRLEKLRKRHAGDPARYWQETAVLMRRHGVRPYSPGTILGAAVQAPVLFGVYSAVRHGLGSRVPFLWIADLARADPALTLAVTGLAATAAAIGPSPTAQPAATLALMGIVAIATAVFLWTTSSAVALNVGAGSLVSVLQGWLLTRTTRSQPGAA